MNRPYTGQKSPVPPRSCEKFPAAGNWGAWGCPGEGQIQAAKTGVFFSVAHAVFNLGTPKWKSICFYLRNPRLPASLCGSQGSASPRSIARRVLAA